MRKNRSHRVASPWLRLNIGSQQAVIVHARTRAVIFELGIAGLAWDSAIMNQSLTPRLGPGWTWGTPSVQHHAGRPETVYVPRLGVFEADPASPSGLAGCPTDELRYSRQPRVIAARAGRVPVRLSVATLSVPVLGRTDHFDPFGNAITTLEDGARRTDREFIDASGTGHPLDLGTIIGPDGSRTTIVNGGTGGTGGTDSAGGTGGTGGTGGNDSTDSAGGTGSIGDTGSIGGSGTGSAGGIGGTGGNGGTGSAGDHPLHLTHPDGGQTMLRSAGTLIRVLSADATNTRKAQTSLFGGGGRGALSAASSVDLVGGERTDLVRLDWGRGDQAGSVRSITHNGRVVFGG